MPQREGKCTNFGLCTMADSREAITLPEGEEFSCPECGKMLAEVEGKGKSGGGGSGGGGKGSGKSKLALAGIAVVLLAGGGYFLLMQPDEDGKDKGDQNKTVANVTPDQQKQTEEQKKAELEKQQQQQQQDQQKQEQQKQQELQSQQDQLKQQQQQIQAKQAELKQEEARLAKLKRDSQVPPPDPKPKKSDPQAKADPKPDTPAYSGPSSGTMVWEGTVHSKGELVTIDNGVPNKGSLISGKLPGVAVLIQTDNPKKVAIASPPGPDNKFQRVVLRVQGSGPQKVTLSWSLP